MELHLNGHDFTAWHCLGRADVLITSGSGSFSFTAAYYSDKKTHVVFSTYQEGYVDRLMEQIITSLPNWHELKADGRLANESAFLSAIDALKQNKQRVKRTKHPSPYSGGREVADPTPPAYSRKYCERHRGIEPRWLCEGGGGSR